MSSTPASGRRLRYGRNAHAAEVHVLLDSRAPPVVPPASRCFAEGCVAAATLTPILRIALFGSEHVSHVALRARVCTRHRETFAARFLTPARRATIETALRTRARNAPDWSRTRVDFAPSPGPRE